MKKQSQHNKVWMDKQKELGLCIFCKSNRMVNSTMCLKHWIKNLSRSTLGDRNRDQELLDLFEKQNGRCYLSGKQLIFGINAGLDHILSIKRYPHLRKDISNVKWIDKSLNEMKRDIPNNEFIEKCKEVLEYNGYKVTQ